jgi:hypothetical protein
MESAVRTPRPSHVASLTPLSNGATNASALPLACPQPGVDSSAFTEDCLSMVIYVPPSLNSASGAPTFMWYVILFIFLLQCLILYTVGYMAVRLLWVLRLGLVWMALSLPSPLDRLLQLCSTVWELCVKCKPVTPLSLIVVSYFSWDLWLPTAVQTSPLKISSMLCSF